MSSPILEAKQLTMRFGGLVAVNQFSLTLHKTDVAGIIGPNGAGKTTIFNMMTGIYRPTSGVVTLDGEDVSHLLPYQITQKGIARTFQNIRLFKDLSVLDNIRLAQHFRAGHGAFASLIKNQFYKREEERMRVEALELLSIFKLENKWNHLAKNLPYGEQRRLEMARALATKPKVLLFDEPAAGMNPQETKELTGLIRWIRDHFQVAILLIEHDMGLVMDVCEKISVVDYGELIAFGGPKDIQNNPKVIEAYLGPKEDEAVHG